MKLTVYLHRLSKFFSPVHVSFISIIIDYLVRFVFSCWLPHTVIAGENLVLWYGGLGVVIHKDTKIGNNVHID
jgi:serine O-acetyltransferase